MSDPELQPTRYGKIVISPALAAWIQRTPSRRVGVHRDRYRPAAPPEPAVEEPAQEPTDVEQEATGG